MNHKAKTADRFDAEVRRAVPLLTSEERNLAAAQEVLAAASRELDEAIKAHAAATERWRDAGIRYHAAAAAVLELTQQLEAQ